MLDGGSAVDAAITSVLCVGVVNQQSSGIGGGLSMVVYIDETNTTEALMAFERAPQAATADMFSSREDSQYGMSLLQQTNNLAVLSSFENNDINHISTQFHSFQYAQLIESC